ncbi:MAG: phosphoribosylglycinamide formyltransferase, partial [Alphaproteobacteria bacterium]
MARIPRSKRRLVVLISGRGSNMLALIGAAKSADYPAAVVKIISNNPNAAGLASAKAARVETAVVNHKDFAARAAFEAALDDAIASAKPDLICLAGFMRILSADFVRRWQDRMINIHPSLLPAFKGLHTHERVLESGVRFTGATVHFVRARTDDGPIIIQAAVPVLPGDDVKSLAARVLAEEHVIYPHAVRLIAEGRVRVIGRHVRIEAPGPAPAPVVNP